MPLQAVEPEIPPDAHGARTELLQVLLADPILVRDVLQREPRFRPVGREANVHPARASHELPRQIERFGRSQRVMVPPALPFS